MNEVLNQNGSYSQTVLFTLTGQHPVTDKTLADKPHPHNLLNKLHVQLKKGLKHTIETINSSETSLLSPQSKVTGVAPCWP